MALGPGAKDGLRKVFGFTGKLTVSEELEMTKTLTGLMDPVFEAQYFLGRRITMKAIEHSLCEFDKYYRAVLENRSKRKYRGGGTKVAAQVSCDPCARTRLCFVWWRTPGGCVPGAPAWSTQTSETESQ